jgi:hypothetical protein
MGIDFSVLKQIPNNQSIPTIIETETICSSVSNVGDETREQNIDEHKNPLSKELSEETGTICKTKEDFINKYGNPTTITKQSDGFFARSYKEDCFLVGGGRYRFAERLEYKIDDNSYKIIYIDIDRNVMKIF